MSEEKDDNELCLGRAVVQALIDRVLPFLSQRFSVALFSLNKHVVYVAGSAE